MKIAHAFARQMTDMHRAVFCRTESSSGWANTEFHDGDVAGVVRELKESEGGDVLIMGSGSIIQQPTDAGLIDEYTLIMTPVMLGQGVTMFQAAQRRNLELIDARTFTSGIVVLRYRPA